MVYHQLMDLYDTKFIIRDLFRLKFSQRDQRICEPDWYYFLHIPKTAGTSFRFSLYTYFSPNIVYPNTVEYYLKNKSKYISWNEFVKTKSHEFPDTMKLLIGHFGLNPLDYYQHNLPKSLCFFRDPLKRVMSTIVYHQQKNRRFANMTIEEILDKQLTREAALQSIHLGYDLQKDNWQQVIANLSKLEFVGISEHFEQSIKLCNRTFNWHLKPVKPRNVGSYTPSMFSDEQISRIKEITKTDRRLYDRAIEIFDRRCKALGID